MKALVVYYSHTGHTQKVAELIAELTQAKLYEVKEKDPYPDNYKTLVQKILPVMREDLDTDLAEDIPDLSAYDTLFIGSPIWMGSFTPPLRRFLSQATLEGKKLIPFCTHGGSGIKHMMGKLKEMLPQREFETPLAVKDFDPEVIKAWIEHLKLT